MADIREGLVNKANGQTVALRSISVAADIRGFVAQVSASLAYRNDEEEPIEATFMFPLDENAAMYKLQVQYEDKVITAECQEKQQARQTYDQAKVAGKLGTIMAESEHAADIQVLDIGNIPAKCDVTITYCYVIRLTLAADGATEFKLPTILNPRYRQPDVATPTSENAEQREEANQTAPHYTAPCSIPYSMDFTATVHTDMPVIDIRTEKLPVTWQADSTKTIQVKLKEPFKFDRDIAFNIYYERTDKPFAVLAKGDAKADGILKHDVIQLNFRPQLGTTCSDVTASEFIFFVDRSGSMRGDRIQQAKEVLTLFIKSLPTGCIFNITAFDDRLQHLFTKSQKYNDETLQEALIFIKGLTSRGGTDLWKAMSHMYDSLSLSHGFPRQVFVLTDGLISNTERLFALIKENKNTTRVFGFGIGSGVSTSAINGLANAGQGRAEFATEQTDRLHPKVISCLKMAMSRIMSDISVELTCSNDHATVLLFPEPKPISLSNEALTVYGLIQGQTSASDVISMKLNGNIGDDPITEEMTFYLDQAEHVQDQWLHRLAAKEYIKMLESDDQPKKNHIILISLSTNVMSKYTAFVAVHKSCHVTEAAKHVNVEAPSDDTNPTSYRGRNASAGIALQGAQNMQWLPPALPVPLPQRQQQPVPIYQCASVVDSSAQYLMDKKLSMYHSESYGFKMEDKFMKSAPAKPITARQKLESKRLGTFAKIKQALSSKSKQKRDLFKSSEDFSDTLGTEAMSTAKKEDTSSDDTEYEAYEAATSESYKTITDFASKDFESTPPLQYDPKKLVRAASTSDYSQSSVSNISLGAVDSEAEEKHFLASGVELKTYTEEKRKRFERKVSPTYGSVVGHISRNVLTNKRQPFYKVIALQNSDGSWDLTQELCSNLELLHSKVTSDAPDIDLRLWATVIVLAWLELFHSMFRDEWMILAQKARDWLKAQESDESKLQQHEEVAKEILSRRK